MVVLVRPKKGFYNHVMDFILFGGRPGLRKNIFFERRILNNNKQIYHVGFFFSFISQFANWYLLTGAISVYHKRKVIFFFTT